MKLYFSYQFIFLYTTIFLSNTCGVTYAQKPILKNYSIHNGLPSQIVYCVTQDLQGYIWFGTDAGVSRFDGLIFENYTIKDGLSDNEILNIHRDSKGRLWFFALNGKLSYYANGLFLMHLMIPS
jgi:ligand-binding sensor domain-containing protein